MTAPRHGIWRGNIMVYVCISGKHISFPEYFHFLLNGMSSIYDGDNKQRISNLNKFILELLINNFLKFRKLYIYDMYILLIWNFTKQKPTVQHLDESIVSVVWVYKVLQRYIILHQTYWIRNRQVRKRWNNTQQQKFK